MSPRANHLIATCLGVLLIALVSAGISGGPNYGSQANVTGVYGGVLSPHPCSAPSPSPSPSGFGRCSANSIGIFSLSVPKTGSAAGPVVIFLEGQAYTGTITAQADPGSGKVSGLLSANFSYTAQIISSVEDTYDKESGKQTGHKTNYTTQTYSASAAGELSAVVSSKTSRFGVTDFRLIGSSDIQFNLTVNNPFDEILFDVVGFKQSNSVSATGG